MDSREQFLAAWRTYTMICPRSTVCKKYCMYCLGIKSDDGKQILYVNIPPLVRKYFIVIVRFVREIKNI